MLQVTCPLTCASSTQPLPDSDLNSWCTISIMLGAVILRITYSKSWRNFKGALSWGKNDWNSRQTVEGVASYHQAPIFVTRVNYRWRTRVLSQCHNNQWQHETFKTNCNCFQLISNRAIWFWRHSHSGGVMFFCVEFPQTLFWGSWGQALRDY